MPTTFDADTSRRTLYTASVLSPVEIRLHSTVSYENPFVATEIDATFTHTDGTTVSIPGFWREGETWAVRFTPTKEGEWRYRVTCKDPTNQGLFAEGTVEAAPSQGKTELTRRGFVTVTAGEHVYRYADGTPFFWLGDTNWQAFTHVATTVCNYPGCGCGNQFRHIVDNRVAKGFTVYQTYFVPEAGNGERPLWLDARHECPDTDVFNNKVDEMFAYLHEQGQVIALGLGCHVGTPRCMELEAFLRFTRYVVARYACYSIIWISGQEINIPGKGKTPGYTSMDYYMAASELIGQLDGYKHPNSAHMFPTYANDAEGGAVRLDTAPWHTCWTIQGGHGNLSRPNVGHMQSKEFYESYYTATGSGQVKPFVESESNYEDINCGPFTGYEANRIGAWRAMLCGSAGFTYGVSGIWAGCYSTDTYTGWYGATTGYSYDPWYIGLDKPGSFEMSYLKEFFEAVGPWYDLIPRFSDTSAADFLSRHDCFLAATPDGGLAVCYSYGKDTTSLGQIRCLDENKRYDAYWFNPRTGGFLPVGTGLIPVGGCYEMPSKPDAGDWMFLLTALGLGAHREEEPFTDLNPTYAQVEPTGAPIPPVSVKAVGGIFYKGKPRDAQVMTDLTSRLTDGDPNTVWTPVANRATQTMLFDLGEERALTHITVTPVPGTIIPRFRVEGSKDGKVWIILTDTSLRAVENPGACSEPLRGSFRYVKLLLLNAETVEMGEDALHTLPYKAMYNGMTKDCYSVTEITDITIFGK